MKEKDILYVTNKIKKEIDVQIEKENYNNALGLISLCADIYYSSNICYYDEHLEKNLYNISNKVIKNNAYDKSNSECIIFYDGFGLNFRGLAQIYLKALCNSVKKVVYITYEEQKNSIPDLIEIVSKNNGQIIFINGKNEIDKILKLNAVVMNFRPKYFFFYSYPSDVIATTLLHSHKGNFIRYQINLTDHAFWLGSDAIDYCIEFRDYGAIISKEKRNIPENKIHKLPFYPVYKITPFQGYPFDVDVNTQRIIFSGGSLYKTFGDNNKYYEVIRNILGKYNDVIFWYAGSGKRTEMDKLIKEYPNRVFLTNERSDLIQILKHSYLYLSTYPICGGLMFQYAAIAKKVPLTLSFGDITSEFLLNQSSLGIEFDNTDDYYEELDKLMEDMNYLHEKEEKVSRSVIKEDEFENALFDIIDKNANSFSIDFCKINDTPLHELYLNNYKYFDICKNVACKRGLPVFGKFPKEFIIGAICKVIEKLKIL